MKWRAKEKRFLGGLGGLTYVSGATLFIFSHWVRVDSAVGEQHHPLEHWLRFGHSTLTYLLIFGTGYLLKAHVLPGLKSKTQLRSGVSILAAICLLWLSALAILYTGDGDWNSRVAWVHGLFGLLFPVMIVVHLRRIIT